MAIVLLSIEFFESKGMSPNALGDMLILSVAFAAYFLIATQLIRLAPIVAGEEVRTDGNTEMAELNTNMRRSLKNFESLEREKANDWQCSNCGEPNGEAFEVCWNCNAER